jgi:hypothetical protein
LDKLILGTNIIRTTKEIYLMCKNSIKQKQIYTKQNGIKQNEKNTKTKID